MLMPIISSMRRGSAAYSRSMSRCCARSQNSCCGLVARADHPAQERVAERPRVCGLLEVDVAVAALRGLIEIHLLAKLLEARGHLAGMTRVHAVVAGRRP